MMKKLVSYILIGTMALSMMGCVSQHPNDSTDTSGVEADAKLVATSPAVADICDKLELDLVGVCETSGTIPDRYRDITTVGMAMNPDLEIIKSLNPDYILSPNSLQNDLQPKYSSIGVKSIFVNLRSVDGMYDSIEYLGKKFGKDDKAEELVQEYKEFLEKYKSENEGKESPKVLILMGLPGSYIVATDNSYVGSLVKMAGGTNVYGDGDGEEFLNANTEDMQLKDPDIILRAAHALPEDVTKMFNDEFATNDIWKHFRAVQNGKVYDLSYDKFGMSAKFNYPEALDELQPLLYE
ncbi:MAG: heme ABC transporter substrate-binding protein IsdE [Lachnospiraceae bacterium]|nr:heme ABC transporter substrate-binding protein IsdE [Lachnospiraceae bacterium]